MPSRTAAPAGRRLDHHGVRLHSDAHPRRRRARTEAAGGAVPHVRPAARHDEPLREHLERDDRGREEHVEGRRREKRPRDLPEHLARARAVDHRGLVVLVGDVLEPRQEDHDVVSDPAPDRDDDDRDQSEARAREAVGPPAPPQPGRRHLEDAARLLEPLERAPAEPREDVVEKPEPRMEDPLPHHRNSNERSDDGQEVDGPIEPERAHLLVEKHSGEERQEQRERHDTDDVVRRRPERAPERRANSSSSSLVGP